MSIDWENRCLQCGAIMGDVVHVRREYCSRKCYNEYYHGLEKAARLEAKANRPRCATCGGPVSPSRFAHAMYCSKECNVRARRYLKTCPHCEKEFMAMSRRHVHCSRRCADLAVRTKYPPQPCEWCGKVIDRPGKSTTRFCSWRCAGKAGMDVRLTADGRRPLLNPVRLDRMLGG
jgi:endogenous inhibitor of DNA gyrase (YacG/DUF329 family)